MLSNPNQRRISTLGRTATKTPAGIIRTQATPQHSALHSSSTPRTPNTFPGPMPGKEFAQWGRSRPPCPRAESARSRRARVRGAPRPPPTQNLLHAVLCLLPGAHTAQPLSCPVGRAALARAWAGASVHQPRGRGRHQAGVGPFTQREAGCAVEIGAAAGLTNPATVPSSCTLSPEGVDVPRGPPWWRQQPCPSRPSAAQESVTAAPPPQSALGE